MKNYIGRQADFKIKLNNHLEKLTGERKDYYSSLSQDELAELKTVLSDINNIFTLRLTFSAVDWLCKKFEIEEEEKNTIIEEVDKIKPNTNGFDIKIDNKKIIAEVKCTFPLGEKGKYLGTQRKGILNDAIKLIKGKKQLSNTFEYYKFLFIIDLGERTANAIDSLPKEVNDESDTITIIPWKDNFIDNLDFDKVYLKTLRF